MKRERVSKEVIEERQKERKKAEKVFVCVGERERERERVKWVSKKLSMRIKRLGKKKNYEKIISRWRVRGKWI